MAEHIHKTYSCDRCKASLGEKLPTRTHVVQIVARFDYRDSPGAVFQWNDLCEDCYQLVKEFFKVTT